ncbi:MAG TPA: hypothetical protein PK559_07575 [Ignavibacteriaceae bacterium]|nr:hypothetical protein [Ignavibacteriaceae bacterium]
MDEANSLISKCSIQKPKHYPDKHKRYIQQPESITGNRKCNI